MNQNTEAERADVMNVKGNANARSNGYLWPIILFLSLLSMSCGGGAYSNNHSPQPQPAPSPGPSAAPPMQGQWEVLFHSDAAPNEYTVLEANLSQSGTQVSVDDGGVLFFQAEGPSPWVLLLHVNRLGGKCGMGSTEQVTFDGTLTDQQPVAQSMTFTLTETGSMGSAVIAAVASTDGKGTFNGTYTLPAACGFSGEHGSFVGFRDSTRFSGSDGYSGNFQGNAIVVHFVSASSGSGVSATGTYNGSSFSLNGYTTGLSLTLTGTISDQTVTWFGLYDSLYNNFRIYDSDANLLGELNATP